MRTRASQRPHTQHELLEALLAGNSGQAKRLLLSAGEEQDAQSAQGLAGVLACGPSGFSVLHAAALTDCHRMVAPLVAAGVPVDGAIEALDGAAAFALRKWLQAHSKLPASKLCAVFRGELGAGCLLRGRRGHVAHQRRIPLLHCHASAVVAPAPAHTGISLCSQHPSLSSPLRCCSGRRRHSAARGQLAGPPRQRAGAAGCWG